MPKATFSKPFDYVPAEYGGRVTLSYKAGKEYTVKQECIDQAGDIAKVKAQKPIEPSTDG